MDLNPERWSSIHAIFGEAIELSGTAREEFVTRACGEDTSLLEEVRELLLRHDQPEAFVDKSPVSEGALRLTRPLAPGDVAGRRFRVVRLLGEGGMGQVWEAVDTELDIPVALKTMHPHLASSEKFAERFRREVHLARQVTHPNVCRIFDAGREGPLLYLTMELLSGETLAARLRRSAMKADEALPLVRQICAGLDAAHAAGVVHRDLKPANILLTAVSGRTVITDFGLARLDSGLAKDSTTVAIGTPAYMAPEQMEGAATGPSADIYSLGVVMYEMLTGHLPYENASPLAMAMKKVKDQPTPIRQWAKVPLVWEAAILKCLAAEPGDRFASAGEVLEAIEGRRVVRVPIDRSRRARAGKWVAAAAACVMAGWGSSAVYRGLQRAPAAAETWYREGVHALREGTPATARRALERVTQIAPGWAAGHARLAQAFHELDQPDQARVAILQALQVQRWFDPGASLVKAIQSQSAGDFRGAAAEFGTLARKAAGGSERTDAMLDWGRALDRAEIPVEAQRSLDEILRANPDLPAANLLRAQLGIRLRGQPDRIRAWFDRSIDGFRVLNRLEALAVAQTELARWLFRQQKKNDAARQAGEMAVASARSAQSPYAEAQALFLLAQVANSAADREAAARWNSQAQVIAEREKFAALTIQGKIDLGLQLLTQDKIDMALNQLETATEEARRSGIPRARARALSQAGVVLSQTGRLPEALTAFQEAGKLQAELGFPREALRARIGEAQALDRLGKYPEAAAMLDGVQRQAAELRDLDLEMLANLRAAQFARNRGEHPAALAGFRRWLELAEKNGIHEDACTARPAVARALINLGDFAAARSELAAYSGGCRQPHHVTQGGLIEALLLTEEGRLTEAVAHYRRMKEMALAQKGDAGRFDSFICTASVLGGETAAKARATCGPAFTQPGNARLNEAALYVQADLFLREGNQGEAIVWANRAREANRKHGNLDDTLYSTLIRGQAEARSGKQDALAATRAEAKSLRAELVGKWGEAVVARYLTRPLIASRWKEIFR